MAFTKGGIDTDLKAIIGQFPIFTGENELDTPQLDIALSQAVRIFSRTVPRFIFEDQVGDGGRYYILSGATPSLASWAIGFSEIISIDWDSATRVASDEGPFYLNKDDGGWGFYEDSTGLYLDLPSSPSSDITSNIQYTVPHTLDEATNTIKDQYQDAILYLTIAIFARTAQIRAEKALDPPAGAEFVTMRNKGSGFAQIHDAYMKLYQGEIGGEDGIAPASATRDWDSTFIDGQDYLFHPRILT